MSAEPEAEEADDDGESGPDHQLDDADYLQEQYHDEDKTQAQIAEDNGVTSSTVSHYMKKHDIDTNSHRVDDERLEDPEWLKEKYEDEELTMQQIADDVGCSDGTVMRRLHEVDGIDIRRSPIEGGDGDEETEEAGESDGDDE